MSSPTYGYTYKLLDALFQPMQDTLKSKIGKPVKYHNFYPFKSKSGRWYAFFNNSYSDIKIYDLETGELWFTNFYSYNPEFDFSENKRDSRIYYDHTNVSTYVPSFIKDSFILKEKEHVYYINDFSFDEDFEDSQLPKEELDFLPIAFNMWTIWAADYEFYVDVLDLSDIDNKVVKIYNNISYTVSRSVDKVRDIIKVDSEFWMPIRREGETEEELYKRSLTIKAISSISVLTENNNFRFEPVRNEEGIDTDDYQINNTANKEMSKPNDLLPWQLYLKD